MRCDSDEKASAVMCVRELFASERNSRSESSGLIEKLKICWDDIGMTFLIGRDWSEDSKGSPQSIKYVFASHHIRALKKDLMVKNI